MKKINITKKTLSFTLVIIFISILFISFPIYALDTCNIENECNDPNLNIFQTTQEETCSNICENVIKTEYTCERDTTLVLFTQTGCEHCAKVLDYYKKNLEFDKNIELYDFNIMAQPESYAIYREFAESYNYTNLGVPILYYEDKYYEGDIEIIEFLSDLPKKQKQCVFNNVASYNVNDKINEAKNTLTFSAIILAALADSINPCAFSVLIILMLTLMKIGGKKRILKVGISFTIAVLISYFVAGIGLIKIVQVSSITQYIKTIAATIAIFVGLINIKDFFFYGKGISTHIKKENLTKLQKHMKKATIPSAIALGFLVSLYELPCTGGVYLAILSIIAQNPTLNMFLILLIYNVIFVLPLLIIVLIINYGINPKKVDEFRMKNRKYMRLLMGLFMISLGILMILGII